MQIVDKIFFDPITKGLKFFSKSGSQFFGSTVGSVTVSEDSKSNLTGTGTFPTLRWSRVGNIVYGCFTGNITGYSVSAANTRTFLSINVPVPTGIGTDWTETVSGCVKVSDNAADKVVPAGITSNGSFKLLIDFTPTVTGTHTFRAPSFTYIINS